MKSRSTTLSPGADAKRELPDPAQMPTVEMFVIDSRVSDCGMARGKPKAYEEAELLLLPGLAVDGCCP